MKRSEVRLSIAWFRREDWDELKRLCPPGDLQDTYDEWLNNTKTQMVVMDLREHEFEKVVLMPDDLRQWRSAHNTEINYEVRARLAVDIAAKRQGPSS
jgi:hypothetical protein